jgi:hypothetical protein
LVFVAFPQRVAEPLQKDILQVGVVLASPTAGAGQSKRKSAPATSPVPILSPTPIAAAAQVGLYFQSHSSLSLCFCLQQKH